MIGTAAENVFLIVVIALGICAIGVVVADWYDGPGEY